MKKYNDARNVTIVAVVGAVLWAGAAYGVFTGRFTWPAAICVANPPGYLIGHLAGKLTGE